jgi:glycosyltransferase involved in cell wall biosynthesis
VATRFAGTDGVSLESAKWVKVLEEQGHVCYWYGGRCETAPGRTMEVPEAYFGHPDNVWIQERVLGNIGRGRDVTERIFRVSDYLKETLYEFIHRFDIEVLVVQNALSLPMQVPLGVAITQLIAERAIPTIAHHHDFYWERTRFLNNAVGDLLSMAFPPTLPSIQHVTINSTAQRDLSLRCGESSVVIPNVLDFEQPAPKPDDYTADFRESIGIAPDDIMILQPTRVVPRKGIEHSISLADKLNHPKVKLVVTHESGDEGGDYMEALLEMAIQEGVDLRFIDAHVGHVRSTTTEGTKQYALDDAYFHADFITYPSLYEGFGNALVEAFYFRKPVLVNRYSIFVADIEPKGFRVITMDGYLTRDIVDKVRCVLEDEQYRRELVDYNYEIAKSYFSYSVLRDKLAVLITNAAGMSNL